MRESLVFGGITFLFLSLVTFVGVYLYEQTGTTDNYDEIACQTKLNNKLVGHFSQDVITDIAKMGCEGNNKEVTPIQIDATNTDTYIADIAEADYSAKVEVPENLRPCQYFWRSYINRNYGLEVVQQMVEEYCS